MATQFWRFLPQKLLIATVILLSSSCEKQIDLLEPTMEGKFEIITSNTGLPGNNIRDIYLDSKGDIWVACYGDGLARYNNESWTIYNTGNSGLLNNNIKCIAEDLNGDMWFGTSNGISFLVDNTEWFYFYNPDIIYNINDILKDSNGFIWVGTEGQKYIYYDYSTFWLSELETVQGINNINCLEEDNLGNIWMGTDVGLFIWDFSDWQFFSFENIIGSDEIRTLFNDSKNRVWIGAEGAITAVYSKDNTLYPVSLQNGGMNIFIRDITEDREKNIWLATSLDGAIKYNGVVSEVFKEFNGLTEDYIEAIEEDNEGNIWIGTSSQGIVKYTPPVKFR